VTSEQHPLPRAHSAILLLITVLVIAATLRVSITSVGPVLDLISADTGLSEGQLGLLGALPVIAFAVVSPLVHFLAQRLGTERAVLLALVVLTAATVLRSVPGWDGWLWAGTAILGAAIAVGNVLVPAIVKRDFPNHVAAATGAYSAVLSGFAALASGLALPISEHTGWRIGLALWAGLSLIAAVVWLPRVIRPSAPADDSQAPSSGSMWRSWTAWHVALYMGAQSTTFYLVITWLPTVEVETGQSPVAAGWHLFVFQMIGLIAGLVVPLLMRRRGDLRAVAAGVGVLMAVAMAGILFAPPLIVLWVVLGGASSGAGLVIALTFMAQRARTHGDASRLSGFAQGIGYALATLGPIGAGALLEWTGAWQAVIVLAIVAALVQAFAALLAGRDRFTHPAATVAA
jgi:MFS transporter, CP family, cyanate transporter